jgi:hypothetical protein
VTDTPPWTCPSCNGIVSTPYCPTCGERPLLPQELTLRGFLHQAFEAFTNIDGRLLRSFRCLVRTQPWSPLAQTLVADRLEVLHTTAELYAPRFDTAVALHARSLILLMALSFAFMPAIVFRRGRHPIAVHAVFTLHLYAFLLLLFCVATTMPAVNLLHGGVRSTSDNLDHALSIGLMVACAVYLYFAIGRVYGGAGVGNAVRAAGLSIGMSAIVLGYRFVLLLITLYST